MSVGPVIQGFAAIGALPDAAIAEHRRFAKSALTGAGQFAVSGRTARPAHPLPIHDIETFTSRRIFSPLPCPFIHALG